MIVAVHALAIVLASFARSLGDDGGFAAPRRLYTLDAGPTVQLGPAPMATTTSFLIDVQLVTSATPQSTAWCLAKDPSVSTSVPSIYTMKQGAGTLVASYCGCPGPDVCNPDSWAFCDPSTCCKRVGINQHIFIYVGGLQKQVSYDIWCYIEDDFANPIGKAGGTLIVDSTDVANAMQAIKLRAATLAGGDFTPPTFDYWGIGAHVLNTEIKLLVEVTSAEVADVYCVLKEDRGEGTTTPTKYEIKDHQFPCHYSVATCGQIRISATPWKDELELSGLQEATTYDAYCYVIDSVFNELDGSPFNPEVPDAILNTKLAGLTTLFSLKATQMTFGTLTGNPDYRFTPAYVEPAAWNVYLPTSYGSGLQQRRGRDLEGWYNENEFQNAQLMAWSNTTLGCSKMKPAPRGGTWFTLVTRGRCTFAEKAKRAWDAGYKGLLVQDTQLSSLNYSVDIVAPNDEIWIPAWLIGVADGAVLHSAMGGLQTNLLPPVRVNVRDRYRKPLKASGTVDEYGTRQVAHM